jgi:hypothetical protein
MKFGMALLRSFMVFQIQKNGFKEGSMPIIHSKDDRGHYVKWGKHGHKYRYSADSERSKKRAESLARKQGRAAYASGYKGK